MSVEAPPSQSGPEARLAVFFSQGCGRLAVGCAHGAHRNGGVPHVWLWQRIRFARIGPFNFAISSRDFGFGLWCWLWVSHSGFLWTAFFVSLQRVVHHCRLLPSNHHRLPTQRRPLPSNHCRLPQRATHGATYRDIAAPSEPHTQPHTQPHIAAHKATQRATHRTTHGCPHSCPVAHDLTVVWGCNKGRRPMRGSRLTRKLGGPGEPWARRDGAAPPPPQAPPGVRPDCADRRTLSVLRRCTRTPFCSRGPFTHTPGIGVAPSRGHPSTPPTNPNPGHHTNRQLPGCPPWWRGPPCASGHTQRKMLEQWRGPAMMLKRGYGPQGGRRPTPPRMVSSGAGWPRKATQSHMQPHTEPP